MRRLMIAAVMAVMAFTFVSNVAARRTYTLEEIEAMKEAGRLKGNERFAIIVVEDGKGLTGDKTGRATLTPSDGSPVKRQTMDAIAYDKVTTTRYLTTMAREYYGNLEFWPYIYEENKDKLGDPDRTTPGTMVTVPDLRKYGVNPKDPADIEKAKRKGKEIYSRYGK